MMNVQLYKLYMSTENIDILLVLLHQLVKRLAL